MIDLKRGARPLSEGERTVCAGFKITYSLNETLKDLVLEIKSEGDEKVSKSRLVRAFIVDGLRRGGKGIYKRVEHNEVS